MKRHDEKLDAILDRYLPSAAESEMESDGERVWSRLRSRAEARAEERLARRMAPAAVATDFLRRRILAGVAAAAVILLAFIGTVIFQHQADALAVVESADGLVYRASDVVYVGAKIGLNETLRSEGSTMLALTDGTRVEMRSKSELWLERADDGVRIRLGKGGVIVNAAKQPSNRHLYVQTKDVTVSVVGTVFLVSTEQGGSRVAVIEGEVRVKQGVTEKSLHPGEQVATNPSTPSPTVKEEVSWSRNAPAHIALLLQSTAASPVTQLREAFDVATIRPYDPGAPTGGRGRVWAVEGCSGDPEVDPVRFAVTGATLHALIAWAYGTKDMTTSDCRGYASLNLISGGPEWIRSDQWDVQAVMPMGSPGYTVQQLRKGDAPKLQAMLRTLLEDRFQLVVRREMKEIPGYSLILGRDATSQPAAREVSSRIWNGFDGTKPSASYTSQWLTKRPEDWQPYSPGSVAHERGKNNQSPEWNGYFKGSDASMSDLVLMLGQKSGRPVLDRTGLAGTFNWYVKHSVEQPPNNSGVVGVLNSGDRAYLFKAVEQLGLKVEDTRAAVEVLVIERVERPSGN